MTRKEEIELAWFSKAVQSNHRYDERSFKEAVEWADKTMIDKACEWLKENADDFGVPESESGRVYVDDLVAEFREAMEE